MTKQQADRDRTQVAQARQSGETAQAKTQATATATTDPYWDLVLATASLIQEWAFWRWLGRRTHFIPWEAYHGLTVRADGQIMDAGACTVAAAYQNLREANPDRPNVAETPQGWMAFTRYVQVELQATNVLKGIAGAIHHTGASGKGSDSV